MNSRALILCLALTVAQAADTGAELFQKAVVQERAAGNLEEAIKLYQRVARDFPADRALAGKALVQAARCYEKLGQDKAVKLYEEVARNFGDQREIAATARERLAAIAAKNARPVADDFGLQIPVPSNARRDMAQVFSDGNKVYYLDVLTGDLMAAGVNGRPGKLLYKPPAGQKIVSFSISRDARLVAILLSNTERLALGVVTIDGSAFRSFYERIDKSGGRPILGSPSGWSRDSSRFLSTVADDDGTPWLGSFSVSDGSFHKIANLKPINAVAAFGRFSPDEHYIAFLTAPDRKIYVAPVSGGDAVKVVDMPLSSAPPPGEDQLCRARGGGQAFVDWTPDGRSLLYSTSACLYAQSVLHGRAAGAPTFISKTPGLILNSFWTKDGSLVYTSGKLLLEIEIVTLNDSGTMSGDPVRLSKGISDTYAAAWSPDGRQLAYTSGRMERGRHQYVLTIRDVMAGTEKEFVLDYASISDGETLRRPFAWSVDGSSVYFLSSAREGTPIERIVLKTGARKTLATLEKGKVINRVSETHDGRGLLIGYTQFNLHEGTRVGNPFRAGVLQLDFASGRTAEVIAKEGMFHVALSPDGKRAAGVVANGDINGSDLSISVGPVGGGEWKQLTANGGGGIEWTTDGSALYYRRTDSPTGMNALMRISAEGGEPVKLIEFQGPQTLAGALFRVHPDGHQALFHTYIAWSELWAARDLLSKLSTAMSSKP